jgi:diguanylate cyclase (GGDEF)-like protein
MLGSVWLTVLSFEALLFTISIAFILLAMAKERTELLHRTAAMVDPLTGIANRRSFLQDAAQLAKRHSANPRPTAVLLIDLDHFKSINDRFGHALGDRALELFALTARHSVRSTDLLGRLGGEEFAAILPDMSRDRAVAVAERIRASFAHAALEVDNRPWCIARRPCSTCTSCWRRPTRRSIAPRKTAATGSRWRPSTCCSSTRPKTRRGLQPLRRRRRSRLRPNPPPDVRRHQQPRNPGHFGFAHDLLHALGLRPAGRRTGDQGASHECQRQAG